MAEAGVVLAYLATYGGILAYVVWLEIRRRRLTSREGFHEPPPVHPHRSRGGGGPRGRSDGELLVFGSHLLPVSVRSGGPTRRVLRRHPLPTRRHCRGGDDRRERDGHAVRRLGRCRAERRRPHRPCPSPLHRRSAGPRRRHLGRRPLRCRRGGDPPRRELFDPRRGGSVRVVIVPTLPRRSP